MKGKQINWTPGISTQLQYTKDCFYYGCCEDTYNILTASKVKGEIITVTNEESAGQISIKYGVSKPVGEEWALTH